MRKVLTALSRLLAPATCRICGSSLTDSEDYLCLQCLMDLPRTGEHKRSFNAIHQRLGHNCHVDQAAGWFWYRKNSPYSKLLIDTKYSSLPGLGRWMGHQCAKELAKHRFFDDADCLVPMPMHWLKKMMRGYNQALEICKGISHATGVPISDALTATKSHGVQARHKRDQRFSKIKGTIAVADSDAVAAKSVIFVDDIITTGASAAEAVRALQDASPSKIRVLCLGLTAES